MYVYSDFGLGLFISLIFAIIQIFWSLVNLHFKGGHPWILSHRSILLVPPQTQTCLYSSVPLGLGSLP